MTAPRRSQTARTSTCRGRSTGEKWRWEISRGGGGLDFGVKFLIWGEVGVFAAYAGHGAAT